MLLLSRFTISGHSMEPTLLQGQTVLVSSIPFFFSKPKIGDIVAFKKIKKIFIKRIAKIDGEKYFVRGDNKRDSMDSRRLGWVSRKKFWGKHYFFKGVTLTKATVHSS